MITTFAHSARTSQVHSFNPTKAHSITSLANSLNPTNTLSTSPTHLHSTQIHSTHLHSSTLKYSSLPSLHPTSLSDVSTHWILCKKYSQVNQCTENHTIVRDAQLHSVRCCSDTVVENRRRWRAAPGARWN